MTGRSFETFEICLRVLRGHLGDSFNPNSVTSQVRALGIADLVIFQKWFMEYASSLLHHQTECGNVRALIRRDQEQRIS